MAAALLIWLLSNHLRQMAHPKADVAHPVQPYGVVGTFWASGVAVRHGLNPHAEYPQTWRPHAFTKDGPVILDVNLNPPALLPLFSFISRFRLFDIARTWECLSTLLVLGVTGLMVWRYRPAPNQVWWLLTGGALIGTFTLQQIYTLLFVLAVGAYWLLEEEHDLAAGIFLGVLCAAKPNFGLWPVVLALTGRRKPLLSASAVFAILSMIPALLYGVGVYGEWIRALGVDTHSIFPSDVTFTGNAARLGARPLGIILSIAVLSLTCFAVSVGKPRLRDASGMAICAAILCSPLAWMHYLLVLVPVLLSRRWTRKELVAAWLLWINPVFLEPDNPGVSHWNLAVRGLVYLVPFLILFADFAREPFHKLWVNFARPRAISEGPLGPRRAAGWGPILAEARGPGSFTSSSGSNGTPRSPQAYDITKRTHQLEGGAQRDA